MRSVPEVLTRLAYRCAGSVIEEVTTDEHATCILATSWDVLGDSWPLSLVLCKACLPLFERLQACCAGSVIQEVFTTDERATPVHVTSWAVMGDS